MVLDAVSLFVRAGVLIPVLFGKKNFLFLAAIPSRSSHLVYFVYLLLCVQQTLRQPLSHLVVLL